MIDIKHEFSKTQAITVNGTSVDSTNTLDLGALTDDRGVALSNMGPETGKIRLVVSVNVTLNNGTSLAAKLQDSADDSTFADTEIDSGAIAIASLQAGDRMLNIPLFPGIKRYIKLVYTSIGDMSGGLGKLDAYLSWGAQS